MTFFQLLSNLFVKHVYLRRADRTRWYLVHRGTIAASWGYINTFTGEYYTTQNPDEMDYVGKRLILRAAWDSLQGARAARREYEDFEKIRRSWKGPEGDRPDSACFNAKDGRK